MNNIDFDTNKIEIDAEFFRDKFERNNIDFGTIKIEIYAEFFRDKFEKILKNYRIMPNVTNIPIRISSDSFLENRKECLDRLISCLKGDL